MPINRLQAWFLACRPKALSVFLPPVLVGTAIARHDNVPHSVSTANLYL
ncbi:MAG: hypothetical protein U0989_17030 [Azonexus sp.]|nr:hypothetical protein [Azonexus sp.]MDZ4316459.1 hypothetical protein [Azonexus sp.]